MKLRNRLYIVVLALFIAVINLVMYIVISLTSEQSIDRETEVVKTQTSFIADSMCKDLKKVMNSDLMFYWDEESANDEFDSTIQRYAYFYTSQSNALGVWDGTEQVACKTSILRNETAPDTEEDVIDTKIYYSNGSKYIYASMQLDSPYSNYKIVYLENINDLNNSINKQINVLIIIDVAASLVLAVLLMLTINRMLRPLKKLSDATDRISQGKFDEEVVKIPGKDEISELASKFDIMRQTINRQISELTMENQQRQILIENMAHELRTPLTSISGYASYLKIAAASEDDRIKSINYIIEESARLEKLSRTMLAIADIRENSLIRTEFSLNNVMSNVGNTLRGIIGEKNITYTVNSDQIIFNGNEPLIESLLLNLSENAMRACSNGGTVTVSAKADETEITLTVADNGIGMTEDELTRIEEPFYRVDKARSRKYGGVGLGTALCRQIVISHGGTISYKSKYGEGTIITVILPIFTTS